MVPLAFIAIPMAMFFLFPEEQTADRAVSPESG
jgi:hypothetical protein